VERRKRGAGGRKVCASTTRYRLLALAPASPHTAPRAGRRPSAAGSHVRQRGEGAELRGQAAAQAVVVKLPASEKGHPRGGERGEREGVERRGKCGGHGRCGGCVPAPRALALSPPRPCLPTAPRAGRRPSAAGSHVPQRGEGAELRGQAAAQAVGVKVPASEKGHQRGVRGVRGRGWRGAGVEWGAWKGVGAVCQPHVLSPSCPLAPASPRRRGQGGGRARRAHRCVSAVRAPSCVGRLPLRLFS